MANVFTDTELARLRSFPEISPDELVRFFTLTTANVEFIDPGRGRGPSDRMGLAVQLCTLPWLGFVPDEVSAAPPAAVARLSQRLGIPMGELRGYGAREQTRTAHLGQVVRYLKWKVPDARTWKELDEFLLARAMEHDSPSLLFRLACEHLSSSMIVRPGPVALLKRVAAAREEAKRETYDRYRPLLKEGLRYVFTTTGHAGKDALTAWLSWARRSRIPAFTALARKITTTKPASTPPSTTTYPTPSSNPPTPKSASSPAPPTASPTPTP